MPESTHMVRSHAAALLRHHSVAVGLAMELPKAAKSAAKILDMAPSPALRIIRGPLEKHTL
jgi:hypothetical protein